MGGIELKNVQKSYEVDGRLLPVLFPCSGKQRVMETGTQRIAIGLSVMKQSLTPRITMARMPSSPVIPGLW